MKMKFLTIFWLLIVIFSAYGNNEIIGKWEIVTYHYIEQVYPPIISEYKINQIYSFGDDGVFKIFRKGNEEEITKGFYDVFEGKSMSITQSYKKGIKVLFSDGSIILILYENLSDDLYLVSIATMVKSSDQLETPVRMGIMQRIE